MNIELKSITKDDLVFATNIRNICRESFFDQREISLADTQRWFTTSRPPFFIIFVDGERVGTISIDLEGEIGNVAILPEWRGKGILREAMSLVLQSYHQGKLHLFVRPENKIAIKAYEKLGFKVTKLKMEKI